jgi:hypothetical protein
MNLSRDLRGWLDDSDCVECRSCGRREAFILHEQSFCLGCKAVWRIEDGEPVDLLVKPIALIG